MPGTNFSAKTVETRRKPSDVPTVPSGLDRKRSESLVVGSYAVGRELGRGAMGVVYLGIHQVLGLNVALKVLHPEFMSDQAVCTRFQAEARNGANVRCPHVVQIIDLLMFPDGRPCIVMEYCPGRSLDLWAGEAGLPDSVAVPILAQVCSGLEATHLRGIVHRDIKAQNVIVANEDEMPLVKIADFGIAKLCNVDSGMTQAGMVVGTPHYMSPEQIRGLPVDARTDIYAVGILAFRLLTGHLPFDAPNLTSILMKHINDAPPEMPGVSEPLCEVVRGALAKDRDDRYADAATLRRALKAALLAMPSSPGSPKTLSGIPGSIPHRTGEEPDGVEGNYRISSFAGLGKPGIGASHTPVSAKRTVLGSPTFVLVLPHRIDLEYANAESIGEIEQMKATGGQLYVPYDGEVALGPVTLLAEAPGAPLLSIEAEVAVIFGMEEASKWNVPQGFSVAIRRNARSAQSSVELTPVCSPSVSNSAFFERATNRSPKDHFAFLGIPLAADSLTISAGLSFFARKLDEAANSGSQAPTEVLVSLRHRLNLAKEDLSELLARLRYDGRIGNHAGVGQAVRENVDREMLARLNTEFAAQHPNRMRAAVALIEKAGNLAKAGSARQAAGEMGRALHCLPLSLDLHRQYAECLRAADRAPESTSALGSEAEPADPFSQHEVTASRMRSGAPTIPESPVWIGGAASRGPARPA